MIDADTDADADADEHMRRWADADDDAEADAVTPISNTKSLHTSQRTIIPWSIIFQLYLHREVQGNVFTGLRQYLRLNLRPWMLDGIPNNHHFYKADLMGKTNA